MHDLAPGIPRPPHAYTPGRTERHPEGWFDALKADVETVQRPEDSTAWRAGLAYFHAGYFWECHEVLEAVWLSLLEGSPERHVCQALIQLANARLKVRMDRPRAAKKICDIVQSHLAEAGDDKVILGLSVVDLDQWLREMRKKCFKMQKTAEQGHLED